MHRSRISLISAVLVGVSAITSAFVQAAVAIKEVVSSFLWRHVGEACSLASPIEDYDKSKPGILVKAKAFKATLMKREKPVLSGSWRMCPSA